MKRRSIEAAVVVKVAVAEVVKLQAAVAVAVDPNINHRIMINPHLHIINHHGPHHHHHIDQNHRIIRNRHIRKERNDIKAVEAIVDRLDHRHHHHGIDYPVMLKNRLIQPFDIKPIVMRKMLR